MLYCKSRKRTILYLAIWVFSATGCGEGNNGNAEDTSPISQAAPAPSEIVSAHDAGHDQALALDTYEEVASYVFECLLRNDADAFLRACDTGKMWDDIIASMENAEKRQIFQARRAEMQKNHEQINQRLRENFERVANELHAWGCFEVDYITAAPGDISELIPGSESVDTFGIHLADGRYISIDTCMRFNGPWYIFNSDPLGIRHTQPYHADKRVADSLPTEQFEIDPPADIAEYRLQREAEIAKAIALGIMNYCSEHKARFPFHVADVADYMNQPIPPFMAPTGQPASTELERGNESPVDPYTYGSFTYTPLAGLRWDSLDRVIPLMYSATPRSSKNGPQRVVALTNRQTDVITEDEFQQLLAETNEYIQTLERNLDR